jgi:hypothetical protein
MNVKINNKFAAITLVSIDNTPIETAGKILLVATARAGFKGMKRNEDGSRISGGTRPTTIEVISGRININGLVNAKSVIIEPLDGAGNPMRRIISQVKKGTLTIDLGKDVTVWYYLTVKR